NGDGFRADRAGDNVLAVWRYVDIVQRPVDGDALVEREAYGVDDVERAGTARNADNDLAAVLADRNIVGMIAERNFLDQLAGLAIEDVERRVGLVADIDPGTVGREGYPMRRLNPLDLLHHLVGGGVDDVN